MKKNLFILLSCFILTSPSTDSFATLNYNSIIQKDSTQSVRRLANKFDKYWAEDKKPWRHQINLSRELGFNYDSFVDAYSYDINNDGYADVTEILSCSNNEISFEYPYGEVVWIDSDENKSIEKSEFYFRKEDNSFLNQSWLFPLNVRKILEKCKE